MRVSNTYKIVMAGLLIAVGIAIPMFSPIKIILEPASFTLASHVAIFIAMFISPATAVAVAIGTTLGFFLGGFPLVVVARAATHVVFAALGGFYIKGKPDLAFKPVKALPFSLVLGVVHAICEVLIVMPFYLNGSMKGYAIGSLLLLVGLGTVVHSMIDYAIAQVIWNPVSVIVRGTSHASSRS